MFPSPFARLFGMVSAPFATNNTVTKGTKLPKSGIVIRKLSFEFGGTTPLYLCLLRRNSCAAEERSSLVTAVRFSNGQEVLSIDYSGAKYVRIFVLNKISHKRFAFVFTVKSEYTLGCFRTIAHNGLHGETGAFPPSATCVVLATERIAGESRCTPYGVCPLPPASQPRWAAKTYFIIW